MECNFTLVKLLKLNYTPKSTKYSKHASFNAPNKSLPTSKLSLVADKDRAVFFIKLGALSLI
jgi:hypothetical protein